MWDSSTPVAACCLPWIGMQQPHPLQSLKVSCGQPESSCKSMMLQCMQVMIFLIMQILAVILVCACHLWGLSVDAKCSKLQWIQWSMGHHVFISSSHLWSCHFQICFNLQEELYQLWTEFCQLPVHASISAKLFFQTWWTSWNFSRSQVWMLHMYVQASKWYEDHFLFFLQNVQFFGLLQSCSQLVAKEQHTWWKTLKPNRPTSFVLPALLKKHNLSLSLFFLGLEFRVHPGHGDGLRLSNNFASILRKSIWWPIVADFADLCKIHGKRSADSELHCTTEL